MRPQRKHVWVNETSFVVCICLRDEQRWTNDSGRKLPRDDSDCEEVKGVHVERVGLKIQFGSHLFFAGFLTFCLG